MADVRAGFVGTIPERYHALLGPLLFEPAAAATAARVAAHRPALVVETACGTGICTRALLASCPPTTRIVATDLSETMLGVAREAFAAEERVTLGIADMAALPADEPADVVACQLGLMFAPDRVAAAQSARAALRPGGRWIATTWAPLHRNPATAIAHETIGRFFPDDPPRFYELPHALGDASEVAAIARAGGFADVHVETVRLVGHASSARDAAIGHVQGTPVLLQIRERDAQLLPRITTAVEHALAGRFGAGPVEVPLEALILTATA